MSGLNSDDVKADDAVVLTRREAMALDMAAVDALLLAAGLERDEITVMRRKLRRSLA